MNIVAARRRFCPPRDPRLSPGAPPSPATPDSGALREGRAGLSPAPGPPPTRAGIIGTLSAAPPRAMRRGGSWERPAMTRVLALWLAVALLALPQVARAADDATVSIIQIFPPAQTDTSAPVRVVVAAQDRASHAPLPGLTAADFAVTEDNNPVTPTVQIGADKLYAAILLDVSSSMKSAIVLGQPNTGIKLDVAKQAAHSFLAKLDSSDQAALYTFSDKLNLIHDFAPPAEVSPSIDSIQAGGSTCLFDSTVRVIDDMRDKAGPDGARAILVLTDGVDEVDSGAPCSRNRLDAVVADARAHDVTLFTVGLGDHVNETDLRNAAEETGGSYSKAATAADLADRFVAVATQLTQHYTLTYHSSLGPGAHQVAVKLLRGANQPPPATGDLIMPDIAPTALSPAISGVAPDCTAQRLSAGLCTAQGVIRLTLDPEPPARTGRIEVSVNGALQDPPAGNPLVYSLDTAQFLKNGAATPLEITIKYFSFQQSSASTQTFRLTAAPPAAAAGAPPNGAPAAAPSAPGGGGLPLGWLLPGLLILLLLAALGFGLLRWARRPAAPAREYAPAGLVADQGGALGAGPSRAFAPETRPPAAPVEAAPALEAPQEMAPAVVAEAAAGPAVAEAETAAIRPPVEEPPAPIRPLPAASPPPPPVPIGAHPAATLIWQGHQWEPTGRPFILDMDALTGGGVVIGRGSSASTSIYQVKLIDVPYSVSREHAVIRLQGGVFYITDKSLNGVAVNGQRIPRDRPAPLPDDSEVILAPGMANVTLRFIAAVGRDAAGDQDGKNRG
jgi:hypothetical protein